MAGGRPGCARDVQFSLIANTLQQGELPTAHSTPPKLSANNINAEVIDLRTLSPIDWDTVIESVESTGRLIVVDEANPRCSIATDVAAHVAQHAFGALKAAPQMVTAPHTPVPFSPVLEDLYIPTSDGIAAAASKTLGRAETR